MQHEKCSDLSSKLLVYFTLASRKRARHELRGCYANSTFYINSNIRGLREPGQLSQYTH